MTATAPPRRAAALPLVLLALGLVVGPVATVSATFRQVMGGRQVTVFGVHATPGEGKDDPRLKAVLPGLRGLAPGHTFRLLKVESKRTLAGESVDCDLGEGVAASATLLDSFDPAGKIQLRFGLTVGGVPLYQTVLATPANQIVYVNRQLPSGDRVILGVGAR